MIAPSSALDLSAPTYVTGFPAYVLTFLVVAGGAFALGWVFRLRALLVARTAAEKAHAEGKTAWPAEGASREARSVVRGRVAPADGERGSPVRIEIRQAAKNHTNKNSKWHTWEELPPRAIVARAFLLERDGEEPVRVEPGQDVFLIDDLTTVPHTSRATRRSRVSELSIGEEVSAYGTLRLAPSASGSAQSAYRGGSMGWVLVPPRGERMVLAAKSLEKRYEPRAAFLLRWGLVGAVAWMLASFVVVAPFIAATAFGRREVSRIVDTSTWITKSKNSTTTHRAIRIETDDGYTFQDEVDRESYEFYKAAHEADASARIPTVHAFRWSWASYLGVPSVNIPGTLLELVFGGLAFLLAVPAYQKRRAWYDQYALSEEGSTGHLSDA